MSKNIINRREKKQHHMMGITQFYMRCDGSGIQVGALFFQQGKNIKTLFSFIFIQLIFYQ